MKAPLNPPKRSANSHLWSIKLVFCNSLPDCSLHPLRVGYYPSPICGSLHVLTDADGRPNAEFARLGYHPGTDSYYHEYSAGRYLSIALTKRARIYAIAVEGSPQNLRYYLKSMEIWHKVSVNDFNVTRGSVVFEDFYKENGIRKVIKNHKSLLKHMKLIQQCSGQMLFYINACAVQQIRAKLTVAACRSTLERRRPHYFYSEHYRIRVREIEKFKGRFVK